MNREDIIRMAREAGMPPVEITSDKPVLYPVPDAIERFANLVRADEREALCRWIETVFASYERADNIVAIIRARRNT